MHREYILKALKDCKIKVTPQRITVMDAVISLKNHPTAEIVIDYIKINHPNIATGTVYKALDTLVKNKLIKKVKTDGEMMRYDAIIEKHHHLYCSESDRIEDFHDNNLDKMLEEYFRKKSIPNFRIEDIKLQIIGKFIENNFTKKR